MVSDTADPGELMTVSVNATTQVAGRWLTPTTARACYVLAHGAGAGMEHPFMRAAASELAALGIATLRYQFPYMQRGSRRPDPAPLCHATVRAAVAAARLRAPGVALFAGGRSFGGRMSSQAQSLEPLPGVRGLAFLGFPLHPAGRPAVARAEHLHRIAVPMLFVQGTRDALAECALLEEVVAQLMPRPQIQWVPEADHAFHVPARSGQKDPAVRRALLGALAAWLVGRA
jgi:predicted alpha/beta-hydrolase family hydrolase